MICQQCKAQGKKSQVIDPGIYLSTCMSVLRYYDEDGAYHLHDPNGMTKQYRCSNGHHWADVERTPCPSCDYNRGDNWASRPRLK